MMICPTCKGAKQTQGIACGPGRCQIRAMNCFTCRGVGEITEDDAKRMERAEIVRRDRIARNLTIREEGKRLCVDFAEWSRIEAGRVPETGEGLAALYIRYKEVGIVTQQPITEGS